MENKKRVQFVYSVVHLLFVVGSFVMYAVGTLGASSMGYEKAYSIINLAYLLVLLSSTSRHQVETRD